MVQDRRILPSSLIFRPFHDRQGEGRKKFAIVIRGAVIAGATNLF
jgi:hypothetical protein